MMHAPTLSLDQVHRAQTLIYETCLALNAEHWEAFLSLCDPALFRYRIVNYSPEIRKEQSWMDRDFAAMKQLVDLFSKHNSDHALLTRHAVVYKVESGPTAELVTAVTSLTVYRTQLDGARSHFESGQTSLYAVGTYSDEIRLAADAPKLTQRAVRLETRQLDIGSHYFF